MANFAPFLKEMSILGPFWVKNGHLGVTRPAEFPDMPLVMFAKVRNISLIHQHCIPCSLKEVFNFFLEKHL